MTLASFKHTLRLLLPSDGGASVEWSSTKTVKAPLSSGLFSAGPPGSG